MLSGLLRGGGVSWVNTRTMEVPMTSQAQIALFFSQLVAWFSSRPVVVRLAIIMAVGLTITILSYSITYAMPLGGGGGGCPGGC
jgi:hypothetical protein